MESKLVFINLGLLSNFEGLKNLNTARELEKMLWIYIMAIGRHRLTSPSTSKPTYAWYSLSHQNKGEAESSHEISKSTQRE